MMVTQILKTKNLKKEVLLITYLIRIFAKTVRSGLWNCWFTNHNPLFALNTKQNANYKYLCSVQVISCLNPTKEKVKISNCLDTH